MSTLRDARLQKALEYAPDAGLTSGKSVGDAIKFEALKALQTVPARRPQGRWARFKAWWLPPGHVPWNAAFASLLLASLVTLVWRGEDTPGAAPEAAAERPVATAPAAPPAQAKVAPAPLVDAPRARPAAPVTKLLPTTPAPTDTPAADAAPAVSAAPPPPAEAVVAVPQASALRAAPAPAAKAMAPSLGRAESAGAVATRGPWEGWTELRVTAAGRTDRVLRSATPGWAGVLQRLVAVAVTPVPLDGVPTLEVELLRGGAPLGRLELAEPWVSWTPAGEASRTGQADAVLLRELRGLVAAEPVTPPDSAR